MKKEESNPSKCPICGRPTHKESEYCIFHARAEEKTEEEFKKALKKYVDKIKEEDGDYNFKKFIFVGNINFKANLRIAIFKNANLSLATFEGDADLIGVTFKGDATFSGANFTGCATFNRSTFKAYTSFFEATFEENAYFSQATFKRDASFIETTFKKNVSFIRATFEENASFVEDTFKGDAGFIMAAFKGDANFNESTFKAYASFFEAAFEENAYFCRVTFKGKTNLIGATFEKNVSFIRATFEENASFVEDTFKGDVDFEFICLFKDLIFSKAKVFPGKKLSLNVIKEKGQITFSRTYLENVFLDLKLAEGVLIDFSDALLSNTKIKKRQIENHILQEKEKKFTKAKEIFLLLKNNFHSIGQYEDENWAFKKEKDME